MKMIMNKLTKNEKGQVLPVVLILMVISGLIIAPLLSYMSSGILAGLVYEKVADELYAADAGIEDAAWKILALDDDVPEEGESPLLYWLAGGDDDAVNNKEVEVRISYQIDPEEAYSRAYKIESTATADDSSTKITSYVVLVAGFRYLFDNSITSPTSVCMGPNSEVWGLGDGIHGNVQCPNPDLACLDGEIINADLITDPIPIWPGSQLLIDFYSPQVEGAPDVYGNYQINLTGSTEDNPVEIGPLDAHGSVIIKGSGWAVLTGTIYVVDDFTVMPNCHLKLDNNAIFSEGTADFKPGSYLWGPGCIISVMDLNFQPNMESPTCDYIFLLCVEGEVMMKPVGNYCGSAAGNMVVDLQPGNIFTWVQYPMDLNFPMWAPPDVPGGSTANELQILTWVSSSS